MKKYNIILIGAGQLGSRHLQAIKKVNVPLYIQVVDPSVISLENAKKRYAEINQVKTKHEIVYLQKMPKQNINIDLAIISTNSDIRRQVTENLIKNFKVKNLILEKLLFQKEQDYFYVQKLLEKNKCRAWVDCSMRSMPFCSSLKKKFNKEKINYVVGGSLYGLVTNAIHYIDHMVFLSDCNDFSVNTDLLDKKIILSKRLGFFELTGALISKFKNGSMGIFNCFSEGDLPLYIDITSSSSRCFIRWDEKIAYLAEAKNKWRWHSVKADLPFQSEMTTRVAEDILLNNSCVLPTYKESAKTHIQLLKPLLKFVNQQTTRKINRYPFT